MTGGKDQLEIGMAAMQGLLGEFRAGNIRQPDIEKAGLGRHLGEISGQWDEKCPGLPEEPFVYSSFSLFTEGSGSPCHMTHMFARLDEIFHAHWDHLVIDQPQHVGTLQIRVTEAAPDGAPQEVVYSFDTPLEHESLVWLEFDWHSYRFRPFSLPQVGETREFAGPAYFPLKRALHYLGNQIQGKTEIP